MMPILSDRNMAILSDRNKIPFFHKLADEADRIVLAIAEGKEKEMYFEPSYKTIYTLSNFGRAKISSTLCPRNSIMCICDPNSACEFCTLERILDKHQFRFNRIEPIKHLLDIFSYPLRLKGNETHSQKINDWFAKNIIHWYNETIYEILKKNNVPYDICAIITSEIYDKSKKTIDDLYIHIKFLLSLGIEIKYPKKSF